MTGRSFSFVSFVVAIGTLSACSSSVAPIAQRSDAVIGGTVDGSDTGVVAVLRQQADLTALCSGALIAPNLVLTARHCVAPVPEKIDCATSQFGPTASARDILVTADTSITAATPWYLVKDVRTPPNADFCGNDIALVFLENRLPSSIARTVIPRIDVVPKDGELLSVVGYGITQPDDVNSAGTRRVRRGVELLCRGTLECGAQDAQNEFDTSEGTCSGDSGGPAFDAQGRVVGVTSRGDLDCLMGTDSDVWSWANFIRTGGNDAASSAGVAPEYWASTGSSAPPPPDAGTTEPADSGPLDTTTRDGGVAPAQQPTTSANRQCNGPAQCFAYEACYSETSQPPGVCVPKCSATSHCASGRSCDATLHVCLPQSGSDSSCTVSSRAPAPSRLWLPGIVALLAAVVRRRGRSASEP